MLERLSAFNIGPIKFNYITPNSNWVRNGVLLQSCDGKMKHNLSAGNEEATTVLVKVNVHAECERPYLELLGSEGKRERHRVRHRETRTKY